MRKNVNYLYAAFMLGLLVIVKPFQRRRLAVYDEDGRFLSWAYETRSHRPEFFAGVIAIAIAFMSIL